MVRINPISYFKKLNSNIDGRKERMEKLGGKIKDRKCPVQSRSHGLLFFLFSLYVHVYGKLVLLYLEREGVKNHEQCKMI